MDQTFANIYRITPIVRNYDWGVKGTTSLVHKLFVHGEENSLVSNAIDVATTPYAELWIGDHISAPCEVTPVQRCRAGKLCSNLSMGKEESMGDATYNDSTADPNISTSSNDVNAERLSTIYKRIGMSGFGAELDGCKILMKVLAIAKPLSLQLHPDPENALRMYTNKHPGIGDSQAKPEMSVALSRFRSMCGFRPLREVIHYADRYPPFAKIIGEELLKEMQQDDANTDGSLYLKLCKKLLLDQGVKSYVPHLVDAVKGISGVHDLSEEVFLVLHKNYGTDVSICFAFVLNCIEIQPGEAFFIPPNTLHSYVDGNCVELMNNSDNVIRCGLTSKAIDTEAFLDLIGVEVSKGGAFPQNVNYVQPIHLSPYVKRYSPLHPICNFEVWSFVVKASTHVSHCFDNGYQPFLCLIVDTNPHVEIHGYSTLENKSPSNNDPMLNKLPFVLGDAFIIYPKVTLEVRNNGTSDFVLYLGTGKQNI
ncbi:mannose-6-phosphate isomerase [Babesia ovis]|uniref:mannose-6-phosphate isomerase n=1 Tax=Babesia ovis TaxID=5869 RepID=A0A9W5WU33_BABOV|nr:mannose-6-phosphate isomerase [Babesia ovis]